MYIYNRVPQKYLRPESDEIIPEYLQEIYETETYKLILDLRKGMIRKMALRAHNGKYVSAVNGGGSILLANKDEIGGYEIFTLIPRGPEQGRGAIRTSGGYFLSATGGGGSTLNANKAYIGSTLEEIFEIIPLYPESIAIRTQNGHYLVAEEPSNLLLANRLAIGDWERFTIVPIYEKQGMFVM